MTVAPTFLYPTKSRRELLEEIAAGRVFRDAAGHDYLSGERRVDAVVREMEQAGWVELHRGALWTLTPYGRAVREVRVLDFGAEASPQMWAEVGDPDVPKVLGHVVYVAGAPRSVRWQVVIGAITSVVRQRPAARDELWHRACIAYAAQAPISQP